MLKDLTNSIKAKLYDFTYTPFMSSVIISWIVLNHKYLLIYWSDTDIDKKLSLLNKYDFSYLTLEQSIPYAMNFYFPILFGLFYVFIYPYASEVFYKFTLHKTKNLKEIKQEIHDKTPILEEEAKLIYSEIERVKKERDETLEKLAKIEAKYKPADISNEIDLERMQNLLDNKPRETDKSKILRFLYGSNYSGNDEDHLIDNIVEGTSIARPKVLKIYKELIKDNLLKKGDDYYIYITDLGNEKLLELFDNEPKIKDNQ